MKSKESYSISNFKPIYDNSTKVLILGSHPSVKSKNLGFYYMNPHNRFWKVLSSLLKCDFINASNDEKERMLLNNNIGLHDVVKACTIIGSSDTTIKSVEPIDLVSILNSSNIKYIFLNGKKAYSLFEKYFKDTAEEHCVSYKVMPSTSPANARYSFDDLVSHWKEILNKK